MIENLERQLNREQASRQDALNKLAKDIAKNERNVNASNTVYGVSLKREMLGDMIAEVNRQINNDKASFASKGCAQRYQILENCLGYVFKKTKSGRVAEPSQMLEPEIACHVALQMTLDAVMLPDRDSMKKSKQTTKLFDGNRPTIAELQYEIGKQLHKQMTYKLLDQNFGRWFKDKMAKSRGDSTAKSSTFYTQNSLDWYIEQFREYCRNDERNQIFESAVWTFSDYQVVGSWLLSIVKTTGLFKKVQSKKSSREFTLEFSEEGERLKDDVIEKAKSVVCQPLPMIIPPKEMTKDTLGGWIDDAAVLNTPTNSSWKGRIELSDKHVDFYNHQQRQAFRINPFVWDILRELRQSNEQLGKFKAFRPQKLIPMWRELEIPSYQWFNCETKDDQDALIYRDHQAFKEVCRARSERYNKQQSKLIEGKPSELLYEMAERCVDEEELFIPIEPDFRSRFTCRTSYLSYQGNDVARGLLTFAHEHPIDSLTKHYLSIHLANQAKMDKESYATRIEWVEQHLDVIETIAVMNDGDRDDFDRGVAYIKEFADKDDTEFQLAAACREYYEIFITHTKTTTSLPCAIDATCSGQQLIAGFLKSAELAARVNVLPTTKPGDIYRDTMDRMLELVEDDDTARFTAATRKALKGSVGRKMSKKGFMSGQYGSGSKRQLEDMFEYVEKTDLKLTEADTLLIKKYWPIALEDICKIRVVFNWFKALVEELHKRGDTEVVIPTPTGSKIHQRYPVPKTTKITTFHFGSSDYRTSTTNELKSTNKADLGKWKTATAANTIHGAGDASLLCLGLHDFEHSFYCVHDSISTHAGQPLRDLQKRLRAAYKEVVTFDLWNEVRKANRLPVDDSYLPALCNDLDLDLIDKSEYLFC